MRAKPAKPHNTSTRNTKSSARRQRTSQSTTQNKRKEHS